MFESCCSGTRKKFCHPGCHSGTCKKLQHILHACGCYKICVTLDSYLSEVLQTVHDLPQQNTNEEWSCPECGTGTGTFCIYTSTWVQNVDTTYIVEQAKIYGAFYIIQSTCIWVLNVGATVKAQTYVKFYLFLSECQVPHWNRIWNFYQVMIFLIVAMKLFMTEQCIVLSLKNFVTAYMKVQQNSDIKNKRTTSWCIRHNYYPLILIKSNSWNDYNEVWWN